jgi:hypothetical protein
VKIFAHIGVTPETKLKKVPMAAGPFLMRNAYIRDRAFGD